MCMRSVPKVKEAAAAATQKMKARAKEQGKELVGGEGATSVFFKRIYMHASHCNLVVLGVGTGRESWS